MMWIDIGIALLLTLRITLFAPALPRLLDLSSNAQEPEEKDEAAGAPLRGDGEVNDLFLDTPRQETVGLLQLHIHVISDSKVHR
jgi:hypothetical protein